MKSIVMLSMLLPLTASAQSDLTGLWRQKEWRAVNGPQYINALPVVLEIEQKPNLLLLEFTLNDGEKDTVIKESIKYGENIFNLSTTPSGRKKTSSFQRVQEDGRDFWIKKTETFTKKDSTKLQSVNEEIFTLLPDGKTLNIVREYNGNDDPNGTEDFKAEGLYEMVTREQLAEESATGKGIEFTEGLTWDQIKAKAEKENKFIFVDCYATWCGPCKTMDKRVYPLNMVGKEVNGKFISIKVQMDTTKSDPRSVRLLYSLARKLEKEYAIAALPTYLFFSSDGNAVHKALGQLSPKDFIKVVNDATNPNNQLYSLVERARKQKMPFAEYPVVIERLREEFNERELAREVAKIYKTGYLDKLPERDLFQKVHLEFLSQYSSLITSKDKLFKLAYKLPAAADSLLGYEGAADRIVNRTIVQEDVDPFLAGADELGKEPNWVKLEQKLREKYSKDLAITYTLDARMEWYQRKQDWTSYFYYLRPYLERHGIKKLNDRNLHRCASNVLKYSNDTTLIKEAVSWMDVLIAKSSKEMVWMFMDTKAYLLYKMNKRDEGIAIIRRIRELFPQFDYSYKPMLERMLKGEEIWLIL